MTEPVRPLEALIAEILKVWRWRAVDWPSPDFRTAADELTALLQAAAPPAPTAELMRVSVDDVGDHVCQHGTALDVHCCNCHSGFIFDNDHECPSPDLGLHRCRVCGTRWLLWPDAIHGGGWNLLDKYQRPGACCDNVAMGEQIEHLRDIPLTAPRSYPKSDPLGESSLRAIQEKFRKQDEEDCREAQDNTPSKVPYPAAPPERVSEGKRDYVAVLKSANSVVRESVLWKRFIDGTPLENDIAVWMTDFYFSEVEHAAARPAVEPREEPR